MEGTWGGLSEEATHELRPEQGEGKAVQAKGTGSAKVLRRR